MRKMRFVVSCFTICVGVLLMATAQQPPTSEDQPAGVPQQPLNVKTGLWQVDMTVKYSGLPPQMQAMVDQLSPEQRSAMGLMTPKPYKTCVTAKNLNTGWVPGNEKCRWTVLKSTSSDLDVQGKSCAAGRNQGMDTDLLIKLHAVDPEHVRATLHGTGVGSGNNIGMDGSYTGKWLGSSCPNDQN